METCLRCRMMRSWRAWTVRLISTWRNGGLSFCSPEIVFVSSIYIGQWANGSKKWRTFIVRTEFCTGSYSISLLPTFASFSFCIQRVGRGCTTSFYVTHLSTRFATKENPRQNNEREKIYSLAFRSLHYGIAQTDTRQHWVNLGNKTPAGECMMMVVAPSRFLTEYAIHALSWQHVDNSFIISVKNLLSTFVLQLKRQASGHSFAIGVTFDVTPIAAFIAERLKSYNYHSGFQAVAHRMLPAAASLTYLL